MNFFKNVFQFFLALESDSMFSKMSETDIEKAQREIEQVYLIFRTLFKILIFTGFSS